MKECGFCGTDVPDNARYCSSCGSEFELESPDAPWLIAPPQWGTITIFIANPEMAQGLLEEVKTVWHLLEQSGQLRLFQGQAYNLHSEGLTVLYAPIYSFTDLKKAFSNKDTLIKFTFSPITSGELHEAREAFFSATSWGEQRKPT